MDVVQFMQPWNSVHSTTCSILPHNQVPIGPQPHVNMEDAIHQDCTIDVHLLAKFWDGLEVKLVHTPHAAYFSACHLLLVTSRVHHVDTLPSTELQAHSIHISINQMPHHFLAWMGPIQYHTNLMVQEIHTACGIRSFITALHLFNNLFLLIPQNYQSQRTP